MNASPASKVLFGEKSLTLVSGDFDKRDDALAAAQQLRDDEQADGPVSVLSPSADHVDQVLEPESRGIWRTALRSHMVLGPLGLAAGLGLGWLLIETWAAAAASPGFTLLFLGALGLFSGGMWAGFITMRPDHDVVHDHVREALKKKRWAVVGHPRTEHGAQHMTQSLKDAGGDTTRSL